MTPWDATVVAAAAGWGAVLPLAIAAALLVIPAEAAGEALADMFERHAR